MNDSKLAGELAEMRRGSLRMLPVATAMLLALCAVVFVGGLHSSEVAFIPGVLIGLTGYWTLLELMTFVRLGRILRKPQPS